MSKHILNYGLAPRKSNRWVWIVLGAIVLIGLLGEILDIVDIHWKIDFAGLAWSRFVKNSFVIGEVVFWMWIIVAALLTRRPGVYGLRFGIVLGLGMFVVSDVLSFFADSWLPLVSLFLVKASACLLMVSGRWSRGRKEKGTS